jgi:phage baseplate assembly protein W
MSVKISRAFKDFSLSFKKHPLTNDIIALNNEAAIKNAVINLIRTRIGERFFNTNVGTSVNDSIFELQSNAIGIQLENEINQVLNTYEPRIFVNDVRVVFSLDENEASVTINYNIIGIPVTGQQELTTILTPTRV